MSGKREPISKKIRFEVFKRDKFTCQYCGRMAPDVILEVDHIDPVSKGGSNDILNLITSCRDCNRGKSDKMLSDNSVVRKQQQQLLELAQKNEQLEMMLEWRAGLKSIKEREIDAFIDELRDRCHNDEIGLTEKGRKNVEKLLLKYNIMELLDALDEAVLQYYDGTEGSWEDVFNKVGGIAYYKKNPPNEDKKNIFYLRKILCNRLTYVNSRTAYDIIEKALKNGADFEQVKSICISCRNWTDFKMEMRDLT